MWYVIQVVGGREETVRDLIVKYVEESTYNEVFVPRYRAIRKVGDAFKYYYPILTPGYVIVDTAVVDSFEAQLSRVPMFTRLLGTDKGFKPLDREERAWLEEWTKYGDRVVQGSTGRIENGRLHIISGPLIGREADIVRVKRRQKRAIIRMMVMGRQKEIELELEIIGRKAE